MGNSQSVFVVSMENVCKILGLQDHKGKGDALTQLEDECGSS